MVILKRLSPSQKALGEDTSPWCSLCVCVCVCCCGCVINAFMFDLYSISCFNSDASSLYSGLSLSLIPRHHHGWDYQTMQRRSYLPTKVI